jgi:hypothetical protein
MEAYRITDLVNSPANESIDVIKPFVAKQATLI